MTISYHCTLRLDDFYRTFQRHSHRILIFGNRSVRLCMQHIRSESSYANCHRCTFIFSHSAWKFEQLECFFERNCRDALSLFQTRKFGCFIITFATTDLHHRTIATNLHTHHTTTFWFIAEMSFTHTCFRAFFHHTIHLRIERITERTNNIRPFLLTFCHTVEIVFHLCGEIIVHETGEVIQQKVIHHNTDVSRHKFTTIATEVFGACFRGNTVVLQSCHHKLTRLSFALAFCHIFALLDSRNRWRIR